MKNKLKELKEKLFKNFVNDSSKDLRKKSAKALAGMAIFSILAQAPACSAEEYDMDKIQISDVEFCSTPEEAFEKIQEIKLGKQRVQDVLNMDTIVPEMYRDELYIENFKGKKGIREFVEKNPQYSNIFISNAESLEEFQNVDDFLALAIQMTRNSTSYGKVIAYNSEIYDKLLETKYEFDDSEYGQMYKKSVIKKLKEGGFTIDGDNPPKYSHMLAVEILRFELEKEDIVGMTEEEVREYANYITTKTAKVDVSDTGIEFTTMNAPRYAVIAPTGNQFKTKFGDPKYVSEAECRDDVYIALKIKGGSGYGSYVVGTSHYIMFFFKFNEVYGLPELGMLEYNDGYYIRNTAIVLNINGSCKNGEIDMNDKEEMYEVEEFFEESSLSEEQVVNDEVYGQEK